MRASCGERDGVVVAFLKIEAMFAVFFFFLKRKNILTDPTLITAEIPSVLFLRQLC